jgi:hypothetical protein
MITSKPVRAEKLIMLAIGLTVAAIILFLFALSS